MNSDEQFNLKGMLVKWGGVFIFAKFSIREHSTPMCAGV